jgi:hypothetical protein
MVSTVASNALPCSILGRKDRSVVDEQQRDCACSDVIRFPSPDGSVLWSLASMRNVGGARPFDTKVGILSYG